MKSEIVNNSLKINNSILNLNDSQLILLKERKDVLVGIRSEKFNNPVYNFEFEAPVEISEMLGNSQIIYFKANNETCSASVSSDINISSSFKFKINTNDLLFFDTETGIRI
ncbi:MAG: hypothetical protein LUH05_06655 [Candidatus Gastranaerophilales bacterium]|nr:hypothetical protein [Candidatus Gastranaerophilales bacterium]